MTKKVEIPEAILFDLGSTLLQDSRSDSLLTRIRTLLKGATFDPFVAVELDLPGSLADAMEATYGDGLEEFSLKKWLERRFRPSLSKKAESPESLEQRMRSTLLSYSAPRDAGRVLRALSRRGIAMGVVSNSVFSSDLLRSELEEHSMLDAFQFVISSAEFGLRKPHPAIFKHAVKKLDADPATTWYVGDLWENDVVGSSGAGLLPVWLNAKAATPSVPIPHLRVRNWSELGARLGV